MTFGMPEIIEIDAGDPARTAIAQHLTQGHIVLLRNIDAIERLRSAIADFVCSSDEARSVELEAFFEKGVPPSIPTVLELSRAIKVARADRFLSRCIAPLIAECGFKPPVRLDGGIPRLVLPTETVTTARNSGLFDDEDFKRLAAGRPTEIFMPAPANIHRDYNRQHYLLQCNMWFTLHDADEVEVLRIFPNLYREPIFNMDATEENLRRLGDPLRYRLAFGDAILFHGEHLHTSPKGGKVQRRFSYDLRIASHNVDDTRHYRDLFLDLRNFPTQPESAGRLGASAPASAADSCALPALLELERAPRLSETELARIVDLFDQFPFAEDRYLALANRAISAQVPAVAIRALQTLVEKSPYFFWVAKAGEEFLMLKDRSRATNAFRKALALTEKHSALPNFMPVGYSNPPTQPLPETIRRLAWRLKPHRPTPLAPSCSRDECRVMLSHGRTATWSVGLSRGGVEGRLGSLAISWRRPSAC